MFPINIITNTFRAIPLIFILLGVVACGGGGGDTAASKIEKPKNITITKLDYLSKTDEGETVTLSLDTQGDDSNELNYDWQVRMNDKDIPFIGDNTSSISFVAPDVVVLDTIHVSVSIDWPNGNLLGITDYDANIIVNDLNPPETPELYNLAKTTSLPKVDMLDLSGVLANSSWIVTNYFFSHQTDSTPNLDIETGLIEVAEVISVGNGSFDIQLCSVDKRTETFDFSNYEQDLSCDVNDRKVNYYQNENAFRVELACKEEILRGTTFKKHSDIKESSYGSLSLTFDSHSEQGSVDSLCGQIFSSRATNPAIPTQQLVFSNITLFSEYLAEPLEIKLMLNEEIKRGFYSLNFLDVIKNEVTITNTQLSNISGLTETDLGMIKISNFSISEFGISIEGDFDIDILDINEDRETVEAEFSITY